MTKARSCQTAAWTISLLVAAMAVVTWGNDWQWQLGHLNPYQVFPLLGLTAYSLMWSHYVASMIRRALKLPKDVLKVYFETTSVMVLALIALHPSLLIYQRFRDGFGLPPHSYETYVAHGLGWVTLLGTASLLVFLFYELRRKFASRQWWIYAQLAVDLAMVAIFYHALRLGTDLRGWFRVVWWFYGVSLIIMLAVGWGKRRA